MKVSIFGGTNPATNPKWLAFTKPLGELLCKNDFEVVWGGNAFGVLTSIISSISEDKPTTLVIPDVYEEDLKKMPQYEISGKGKTVNKLVKTKSISNRTHEMLKMAEAVVVVPGGIGTIYEFWTAIEGRRAEEYNVEIIMLNYKGFFNKQLEFFDFINKNGFTKIGVGGAPYKIAPEKLFKVVKTPEQVIEVLKQIQQKKA